MIAGCEGSSAGMESTARWGVVGSAAIEAKGAAAEAPKGRGEGAAAGIVRSLFHDVSCGDHAANESHAGATISSDARIGA